MSINESIGMPGMIDAGAHTNTCESSLFFLFLMPIPFVVDEPMPSLEFDHLPLGPGCPSSTSVAPAHVEDDVDTAITADLEGQVTLSK